MILLRRLHWMLMLALILGVIVASGPAWGEESILLAAAEEEAPPADKKPAEKEAAKPAKPLDPFTIGVEYTLVSDYIWRGVNLTEYAGEGRESLVHQVGVSAKAALKDLGLPDVGAVKLDALFHFYQGNEATTFNPTADDKLMRADYTVTWICPIPDTPLTVAGGWRALNWRHFPVDELTTEVFAKVILNDGFLLGQDDGVFNPSLAYVYDYDLVNAGVAVAAIDHKFSLDDVAEELQGITVTPSAFIILDNRYLDSFLEAVGGNVSTGHKATTFSSWQFGLTGSYDLGSALEMDSDLTVSLFANFSQGLARRERAVGLNDEFFGGLKIGWSW